MIWFCFGVTTIVGLLPRTTLAFVSPSKHEQQLRYCGIRPTLERASEDKRRNARARFDGRYWSRTHLEQHREEKHADETRRNVFQTFVPASLAVMLAFSPVLNAPLPALAKDDALFRKNPLTNPLLEQIRIWNQAEADEFRYGGELERGEAEKEIAKEIALGRATASPEDNLKRKADYYARLLVPILAMADELHQVNQILQQTIIAGDTAKDGSSTSPAISSSETMALLRRAQEILSQSKYDTVEFKKAFNAFGDNIYYTDPDRANLYLGGGATPKSSQSMAYLLRNDILTNVQDMRAEIAYLIQSSTDKQKDNKNYNNGDSTQDLVQMAMTTQGAMTQYLNDIVPPQEIEQARALMNSQQ